MDEDAFSSPPPVPFRAPSRAASHHRRNSSLGAVPSSAFEPFSPVVDDRDIGSDNAEEEPFSTFDPRRFTPTLHANLVSEILSLRRELESKNKEIGKLEMSLDESQNEYELLNEDMTKVTKENRSLKKQMSLLEGGTLSAITEIAKERDEAVENITDVRKRLEQAQKKLKSKEDEVDRSQSLWERDRENWDTERRNWERKVHVVENRLKTILHEVAAAQAAGNLQKLHDADEDATKDNSTTLDSASVRSSSAFDRRPTSASSASTYDGEPLNSGRFSSMSFANASRVKGDGFNLADELALDEDEEDYMDLVDEIPEMRPLSVASQSSLNTALKARKILGLSMDGNVAVGARDFINLDESATTTSVAEVKRQPEYRDVGIQFTPPPSPLLPASDGEVVKEPEPETIPTVAPEMKDTAVEPIAVEMFSTSCQTDDVVISVAAPESVAVDTQVLAEPAAPVKIPTVSASTQTDVISEEDKSTQSSPVEEPQPTTVSSPTVPTIAIIPPGSEPATPRSSLVLPPHTKSIACQTEYGQSYDMRSVGMQTEAIQVDQRPVKLPASLLPSAILDKGDKVDAELISMPFMSPPPRSPHRPLNRTFDSKEKDKKAKTQPDLVQAYPGNNDNGPLAEDDTSDIRRPFRSSSLFAGFDTNDDELPQMLPELPDVFSDEEIFNRPMASYTLRSGRMVNRSGLSNDTLREEDEFDIDLPSTVQGGDNSGRKALHSKSSAGSKQPDMRRSTLITNGAAAHQRNRPRSPSDPSIDSASTGAARPPFPVPVRLSSRNVPTTNSDSNQSPTPYSDGNSSTRRRSRRITRQPTLRKVRSATAMQKNQQERAGSRSPPPMSASGMSGMSNSSYAPDSPQLPPLPPMPTDEVAIYRPKRTARRIPSSRPGSIRSQAQSYSIEEPVSEYQSTNVVDAIAQTMVGEWMFKYVRRRKSFGMSDHKDTIDPGKSTEEVSASITSTGVRHKRWVWLAPYERAVMWSSKQPTSGPALLGKNGRKLIIQSVLDVKDDTPLPKGSNVTAPFNRSILILTPQRALKFTAMSIERHYVWLTALSFLSHTSIGMGELPAIPPPIPQEEYNARPPTASLRRNPIRDSIRVAKGKPRPQPSKRSFTDNSTLNPEYSGTGFDLEPIMDAADPPNIPRYAGHTRKRSNTAPKAPLTAAFRSFSSHATLPSNYSAITAASSDIYATSSMGIASGLMSGRSSVSRRTSEASGPSSIANGNLFDPMGTVRMEAFIDRVEHPRSRTTNLANHNQRNRAPRKVDNVQWNAGNSFDLARSEDGSELHYRNDELFRGF